MLDFNLWTWNSRAFPGIDSLNVRLNDKVRIRIGNLTMTNHPIHLHGHEFVVTGTDGGPTPKSTRWHEVTTDVAVGQMRQIEFVADEEGDWAFHCHKSHHTMNAMGHDVPTMIGVDHRGLVKTDHFPHPRLHGDGRARHGRHGRDGNAAARQHAADDDRHRPVRPGGDGRHVHRLQGAPRPEARRLQGSRAGTSSRRARRPTNGPARSPSRRASSPRAGSRCRPPASPPPPRSRCANPRAMAAIEPARGEPT